MKIFWSWQSDTHQPSGRYFVRDVLQTLAAELDGLDAAEEAERPSNDYDGKISKNEENITDRISVDHDTLGVGGSPRVADTILRKIEEAAVFVADVTPIDKSLAGKKLPNPNVMIELGYALKVMGLERIVLVMNQAEGAALSHLPFDLRHWRAPVTYKLKRDETEERRAEVAEEIKKALRTVILPSLDIARKAFRERNKMKERRPNLILSFAGEGKDHLFSLKKLDKTEFLSLDKIKTMRPLLSEVALRKENISNLARAIPSGERENYDKKIIKFYKEYQFYIESSKNYLDSINRSIVLKLSLTNEGTLPASNIDIVIKFPENVAIPSDKGDFPDPPEQPIEPVPPRFSYARPVPAHEIAHPNDTNMEYFSNVSMKIDRKNNRIIFQLHRLKHHHDIELNNFALSFRSDEDIGNFNVEYRITADELLDPISGILNINIAGI